MLYKISSFVPLVVEDADHMLQLRQTLSIMYSGAGGTLGNVPSCEGDAVLACVRTHPLHPVLDEQRSVTVL